MSDEPKFEIELDGLATLRLFGDVDATTARVLAERLDAVDGDVVLALSQVSFIDSHGLRVILTARQARRVTLVEPSEMAMSLLDRTGVSAYLRIVRR